MAPMERAQVQFKNFFRKLCCRPTKDYSNSNKKACNKKKKKDDDHDDDEESINNDRGSNNSDDDDSDQPPPQYRLEATNTINNGKKRRGFFGKLASCCCGRAVGSGGSTAIGINHNQRLASTLHWMFRVNFIFLFAVMCTIFFVLVMIFAGFIVLAGRIDDQCVRVGECFGRMGSSKEMTLISNDFCLPNQWLF